MDNEQFEQQIQAFGKWKADLEQAIRQYEEWLEENNLSDPEVSLRLYDMLEAIKSDRITVAFVAEVSTGKTELINAIFFANYKRRLLPSEAGRTTMCPTELFYDKTADEPYVRLLPIETRLEDTSIAQFKRNPINWSTIRLDISSADSMAEALTELTGVKQVTVQEAKRLRLYDEWQEGNDPDNPPLEIEIPKWRHAMISFPHPLLEQGMVVLDTPGLNALGSEPELTLNMLPNAQAVLFLLGADTGVTKSELDMWKHHVQPYRTKHKKGLLAVMNKIDTLWDELKEETAINATIEEQCRKSAEMLGIPRENIFPVSAQKALLAKIKGDGNLLQKSGLIDLEDTLLRDVLPEKHRIIRDNIVSDLSGMVESSLKVVRNKLAKAKKQEEELQNLSGKNKDVIEHLLSKTREEQSVYNKNVESLQSSRRALTQNSNVILNKLSPKSMDPLVAKTREEMSKSWTTAGMKGGMKLFFDNIRTTLIEAGEQADKTHKLVNSIFKLFHEEHGFADIKPLTFTTKKYQQAFDVLYKEAEIFRTSPITTMSEQSFVVKKFFITLVSQARNIFFNAHHDADKWAKTVMAPLIGQVRDHKKEIEKRLETLRKISESRETLQSKMEELEQIRQKLSAQEQALAGMLEVFNRPLDIGSSEAA
jgi:hypothetical protein